MNPPDDDSPRLLPILAIQPRPIETAVSQYQLGREVVSAIVRVWKGGDAGRCGLCRACAARPLGGGGSICGPIQVKGAVDATSAPLFSTLGRRDQGDIGLRKVLALAGAPAVEAPGVRREEAADRQRLRPGQLGTPA